MYIYAPREHILYVIALMITKVWIEVSINPMPPTFRSSSITLFNE